MNEGRRKRVLDLFPAAILAQLRDCKGLLDNEMPYQALTEAVYDRTDDG